jgi:predicted component of type VI protein secretion system
MLRGYFGFPKVRILQFAPAWVDIPVLTRLGSGEVALGASTRLGHRMEDLLSRFIVEIGPLPRAWFNRFLPSSDRLLGPYRKCGDGGGRSDGGLDNQADALGAASSAMLAKVKELIDAYLRDPFDYEVRIILEPDPGRPPALGEEPARLGMGIWLGERPAGQVACRL